MKCNNNIPMSEAVVLSIKKEVPLSPELSNTVSQGSKVRWNRIGRAWVSSSSNPVVLRQMLMD